MKWSDIINDKNASEEFAFDVLTSMSFDKNNMPPYPWLVAQSSVPTLCGKHMLKKYFKYGEGVERPDIQSDILDLGIEITRIIDEQAVVDMKTIDKASQGAKNTSDFLANLASIDKRGVFRREVCDIGVGRLISFDTANIVEVLRQTIQDKVALLPTYNKFNDNWLFMLSLAYVDEKDLLKVINNVKMHDKFDAYIFMSASNTGEFWCVHKPYSQIEKRVSPSLKGIRNG